MHAKRFFVFCIILFLSYNLFAQNKEDKTEEKTQTVEEINENIASQNEEIQSSWQTLEWTEKNPAFVDRYEVIIEMKNRRNQFTEVRKIVTEDNSTSVKITPQLAPGEYRYKVKAINLIGLPSTESNWETFVLYQAREPEINSIATINLSSTLYVDQDDGAELTITGKNLFNLPVGTPSFDTPVTTYKLVSENGRHTYTPTAILDTTANGTRIKMDFDFEELQLAKYYLVAKDGSSLENIRGEHSMLTVRFRKWMDLNLSLGYMPVFVVTDDRFGQMTNQQIMPMSGLFRVTFLPLKRRKVYFGVGLNFSYTYQDTFNKYGDLRVQGHYLMTHLNAVLQVPLFRRRARFEMHLGVGLQSMAKSTADFPLLGSFSYQSVRPSYDGGLAFQWFVAASIYVEACVDFAITHPAPPDILFGAVTPSISVGWQF